MLHSVQHLADGRCSAARNAEILPFGQNDMAVRRLALLTVRRCSSTSAVMLKRPQESANNTSAPNHYQKHFPKRSSLYCDVWCMCRARSSRPRSTLSIRSEIDDDNHDPQIFAA